jgi:predicted dehydrogenase
MLDQEAARIAFVGAGGHSTESLMPNIGHLPAFDLVAVCDLQADRARHAARKFGAPAWFTDVETMLDQIAPRGVCIVGPAEMHYSVGLQVLRRGIPIFVEKPPALTLAQARELQALAVERHTWGMVGFMKRFAPANVVAREYMATPAFGQPSSITLIHGSGPYDDARRMLLFNGIHPLDVGRFLMGEVERLFAYSTGGGEQRLAVGATLRYRRGVVGQFMMNCGHDWSDCFEQTYISGSGAGIVIDNSARTEIMSPSGRFAEGAGLQLFGWSQRYYVSGNMAGWAAGGHYTRGYWGELDRFARAVAGQCAPTPTLEDGVEAMRLIEAILLSASTGTEVRPDAL